MEPVDFLQGEFRRTLDERYRLSIPSQLADPLVAGGNQCVLTKERPGALSLWNATRWKPRWERELAAVRSLIEAGRLQDRLETVQALGRLLSTRHRDVQLAGRGRLAVPEGFREFLGVEPGGEVLVVGAALCVEIWKPEAWFGYLEEQIPHYQQIVNELLEKQY